MVQIKNLISVLLAASGSVSALPSPTVQTTGALTGPTADLDHGIYIVDLSEDGSTVWNFVAHINETLKASQLSTRGDEGLDKRDGVTCNGFGTPADDVNVAQGNLANQCGGGYYWTGRAIAAYYGTGVAFACNYASGETCYSGDYWDAIGRVNSACGFTHGAQAGAGYFTHVKWKLVYGRTSSGSGFC